MGLVAGSLAGRQSDEIVVDFEIFSKFSLHLMKVQCYYSVIRDVPRVVVTLRGFKSPKFSDL